MKPKIHGVRDITIHHGVNEATTIDIQLVATPGYNAHHLYEEKGWSDLFPGNVIVKCSHCGQWAASKTACVGCGAPVE